MSVFGVLTQHTTPLNGDRVNTWYVQADSLGDATVGGNLIVDAIKAGFGSLVTFFRVHAWVPGSNPNQFLNLPIDKPGTYTAIAPTSAQVVTRIEFAGGVGDYPHYKDFRICINPDQQVGTFWNTSFTNVMVQVATNLGALDFLCTKTGTPLTNPSWTNEVRYRQLSKTWYNRAPANLTLKQLRQLDT